jgi:hypothetical protein
METYGTLRSEWMVWFIFCSSCLASHNLYITSGAPKLHKKNQVNNTITLAQASDRKSLQYFYIRKETFPQHTKIVLHLIFFHLRKKKNKVERQGSARKCPFLLPIGPNANSATWQLYRILNIFTSILIIYIFILFIYYLLFLYIINLILYIYIYYLLLFIYISKLF